LNRSDDYSRRIGVIFQHGRKSINDLYLPALGLLSILFFAFIPFDFTQVLAVESHINTEGAASYSEISRGSNPSLTNKASSADSSYILQLSLGKLIPQQSSLPPPDYTGSDSFSEQSRGPISDDPLLPDEDPLLPLLP
jgi:hypothetical protein